MTRGEILRDLLFLGGAGAAICGVRDLSVPAAWILAGLFVMYLAYVTADDIVPGAAEEQPESRTGSSAPLRKTEDDEWQERIVPREGRPIRFDSRPETPKRDVVRPDLPAVPIVGTQRVASEPWREFVAPAGEPSVPEAAFGPSDKELEALHARFTVGPRLSPLARVRQLVNQAIGKHPK